MTIFRISIYGRATRIGRLPVVWEESLHMSLPPRVPVEGVRGTFVGGFTRFPLGRAPDGPTTRPNCPLSTPLTLGTAERLTARSGAAGLTSPAAVVAVGGGGGGPEWEYRHPRVMAMRAAAAAARTAVVREVTVTAAMAVARTIAPATAGVA